MCGTNNGFEDREGHQAPFTLRKDEDVEPAVARLRRVKSGTGVNPLAGYGAGGAQQPTSNVELKQKISKRIAYLIFLIAVTMESKSGQSPDSSLEWSSFPLARISKAPPLEGMRVSDAMRSPSSRILVAKLTAFGV